jgi:hypothetical protein
MVERPSIKVTSNQVITNLSDFLLVDEMRTLNILLNHKITPPNRHNIPKIEPAHIAIIW